MTDLTEGKLDEVLLVAKEKGNETLQNCLNALKQVDENLGTETQVFTDFAPLSFGFTRKDDAGNFRGNGGIIFHGNHDGYGSGSAPSFSVSIEHEQTDRWQIHT